MKTLYLSRQGSTASIRAEMVQVRQGEALLQEVQLPFLEQILVFGNSRLSTPLIRACLQRDIPVAYLSRLGWCYGRLTAIARGYRYLSRYQQELGIGDRLVTARAIVQAKLRNSRTLLLRQANRHGIGAASEAAEQLSYLVSQVAKAAATDVMMGLEGSGARVYFQAFGACLRHPEFCFTTRSKQPPGDPVNALLSFGYQVLWNHLLTLIELQGLDPYQACLHSGHERHAALASDLLEEFRAPLVDSLVLELIHRSRVAIDRDFEQRDGGCFLNESGRRIFLQALLQRMEEMVSSEAGDVPRWDLLNRQVKAYRQFVYSPVTGYAPYLPR